MSKTLAVAAFLCISIVPALADQSPKEKPSPAAQQVQDMKDHASADTAISPASNQPDYAEDDYPELVIQLGLPDNDKHPKKADAADKADDAQPTPTGPLTDKDKAILERRGRLSKEALSFRGTPYVWGGENRFGFDCSGFTQYLYGQRGINIPRTAKQQFASGTPVKREDLREGDLVFFNTRGPISHVGIYIGDGTFCHAANPRRGVTVNRLDDSYYAPRYAGARRYAHGK